MDWKLKPCTTTSITATEVVNIDMGIGKRLKPCTTTATTFRGCEVDRLTTLPGELLIRILSLLPTKDAAAACVLSKQMMRDVFPWITSLDLDDSPITYCMKYGDGFERFPTFVTFVDYVLRAHQPRCLTRFRLGVGVGFRASFCQSCGDDHQLSCGKGCLPDLNFTKLNAWLSFPFASCGLRELELCIQLREVGGCQLSQEIFTCETLEVLKLDVNLGFDLAARVPSFRLPKLKLFLLSGVLISDDGFLTRLVSSCPLLEDLNVDGSLNNAQSISLSSPSIRRMCLDLENVDFHHNTDTVLINTPNLEYLYYSGNLAHQHSITKMDRLVKANISIVNELPERGSVSFQQMLSLISPLSNVQHLALTDSCTMVLNLPELNDQLPMFHNLKYLELDNPGLMYWDKLLLPFLNCSPSLETLVFPQGFMLISSHAFIFNYKVPCESEREFCRKSLATIPLCCRYHLKRIVIKQCFGSEREINLIQFLLRHAFVLEEVVIILDAAIDQMRFESTLQNLPRASVTCSIQVQQMQSTTMSS